MRGGYDQGGGGIYVESGASLTLEDAVVTDNDAFTGGGGIYIQAGGEATVRRTSITGNRATGAFGGGIWNQGELDLIDSVVIDNESNRAGGIRNDGEMRLRNVTVSSNIANSPEAGVGGISQNGFAFLNNVTITLNHGRGDFAGSFRGGGIQTSAGELTVLTNSVIAGNDGHGGPADCVGDSDVRQPLQPDRRHDGLRAAGRARRPGSSASTPGSARSRATARPSRATCRSRRARS